MKETNEFDVLLRIVEVVEKKITLQQFSLSSSDAQVIRTGMDKINMIVTQSNIQMGDNINIESSQVGAIGSNSTVSHNNFNQQFDSLPDNYDFEKLTSQLNELKQSLCKTAKNAEEFKALAELALASEASDKKDGKTVVQHLKAAGLWVLNAARDIGIEVAAELIKTNV